MSITFSLHGFDEAAWLKAPFPVELLAGFGVVAFDLCAEQIADRPADLHVSISSTLEFGSSPAPATETQNARAARSGMKTL